MTWITAKIEKINPLSNTIVQLLIQPTHYISYQAGQYLQLRFGDYQAYFSIANAPMGASYYELHIRHDHQHAFTKKLLKHIQTKGTVEIQCPLGDCHLQKLDSQRPIIFIAGGTGFAPIKAMMEGLLFVDDHRHFECYWGAKAPSDLYWQLPLLQWKENVSRFSHLSMLTGQQSYQLMNEIFLRHEKDLLDYQFVIAGSFDMVYHFRDQLVAKLVMAEYIFSDAFAFENA
ncbi:MAG: NAD(P)H-flavin reductase [Gammaproteobacteria bacterium]|nr:NAD(P)H-flavin reductase [Gammaproteobacteria bacterium]